MPSPRVPAGARRRPRKRTIMRTMITIIIMTNIAITSTTTAISTISG